eukprot:COSAG02_NODE_1610_length_11681_cov_11.455103_11_plen_188_part_00
MDGALCLSMSVCLAICPFGPLVPLALCRCPQAARLSSGESKALGGGAGAALTNAGCQCGPTTALCRLSLCVCVCGMFSLGAARVEPLTRSACGAHVRELRPTRSTALVLVFRVESTTSTVLFEYGTLVGFLLVFRVESTTSTVLFEYGTLVLVFRVESTTSTVLFEYGTLVLVFRVESTTSTVVPAL